MFCKKIDVTGNRCDGVVELQSDHMCDASSQTNKLVAILELELASKEEIIKLLTLDLRNAQAELNELK